MKAARFILLLVVLLQFSCLPKKPEIAGTEVSAAPLVRSLDEQRRSFASLKALAGIKVVRRDRKRSFDTVGIVLDAQRRLRVEAFGPLGQSVIALVWDGTDVLLRQADDDRIMSTGPAGIERTLGMRIEAKSLCALLSGTIPEIARPLDARAYCVQNGACVLELADGEMVRRVRLQPVSTRSERRFRVVSQEVYVADTLAYRVRYEGTLESSGFLLPRTILIENPEKKVTITIDYTEADVNVTVDEDNFTLKVRDDGAGAR